MSRDQHYIQVQHYLMRNMWSYLVFNNITNNFVVEIINWAPINSFFYILLLQGLKWNGSNVHNWKLKAREQILKLIRWFRSNIQFQNIIEWAKKYLQTLNSDWILKSQDSHYYITQGFLITGYWQCSMQSADLTCSAFSVSSMKICWSFSFTKLIQNCSNPFF